MIGTVVGNFRIVESLGRGGMGAVYTAEHELLGKRAAVKVLHPEMRSNRDVVNRFFNEARATSHLKHPGIVEVFDFGYLPSGDGYIIMELLEGESLAQRLKRKRPVDEREAARLLRGVCGPLSAAHARGIVHRDLKPDNVFLVADPEAPGGVRVKLLDFGIAKLTDPMVAGEPNHTHTGTVMGTPRYMAPEQCRGAGEVDYRADLYSLGCILYELMAGRPPFTVTGSGELIGAHLYMEPEPPSRHATVSNEMEALIMGLLAKDPSRRPQSARAIAQELAAIAGDDYSPSQPDVHPTPAPGVEVEAGVPTRRLRGPDASDDDVATVPYADSATSSPSTLTSAASQSVAQRGRKKPLLLTGALAVGGLVGGALYYSDHRQTKEPAPRSVTNAPPNASEPAHERSRDATLTITSPTDAAMMGEPVLDAAPPVGAPTSGSAAPLSRPDKPTGTGKTTGQRDVKTTGQRDDKTNGQRDDKTNDKDHTTTAAPADAGVVPPSPPVTPRANDAGTFPIDPEI